ncbi:MAG: hypothetical protein JNN15_14420, partial [Blastocatellia bacterium]|nr:hypothetical protein [Blastocatellia bacterium]
SDTVKRQTTQVKRNEETKHVSGVLQLESDSQEKPVSQVETLVHNSDVYIKTEAVSLKPGQKVYLAAQNLSDGNSEKVSKRVGSDKKLVVGAVVLALLGLGSVATWSMLRTAKQPTISVQPSAVVPPTTASPTPPSSPKNGSTEEIKSSNIDSGKETTSSSEPVSQPKERPDKSTARTDEKIEVDKRKQDDKVKGDVVEDAVLSPRQKNTSRRPAVARAQARRDNKKAEKERKKEEKRGNKKKRRRGVFGTIKDIFD